MGKAVKNSQNLVNVVYGCPLLGKNATSTRKLQLATPFQTLKRMIVKTVLRFLSDCLLSHLRKTHL